MDSGFRRNKKKKKTETLKYNYVAIFEQVDQCCNNGYRLSGSSLPAGPTVAVEPGADVQPFMAAVGTECRRRLCVEALGEKYMARPRDDGDVDNKGWKLRRRLSCTCCWPSKLSHLLDFLKHPPLYKERNHERFTQQRRQAGDHDARSTP